jgi:hypothetical protein
MASLNKTRRVAGKCAKMRRESVTKVLQLSAAPVP